MPLSEADLIVDRRRLKRHLSFWRVAAILLAVVAVAAAVGRFAAPMVGGRYIARLNVEGVIVDDPRRTKALADLSRDGHAVALIVRIDSPGGTVSGGETLYRDLRRVGEKIPVVAVLADTAASGGYMTALGADWIVARESTITGSIGVLMQNRRRHRAARQARRHRRSHQVGSAQGRALAARAADRRGPRRGPLGDRGHVRDVRRHGRRSPPLRPRQGAPGRRRAHLHGPPALPLGLVDALGGEDTARAWLEAEKGVAGAPRCAT
jgi:protease-4